MRITEQRLPFLSFRLAVMLEQAKLRTEQQLSFTLAVMLDQAKLSYLWFVMFLLPQAHLVTAASTPREGVDTLK